jgi:hypothetical protein
VARDRCGPVGESPIQVRRLLGELMPIQVHGLLGEEPSELIEEELGGRIHGGVPKSTTRLPDVSIAD